jgi:hypothetical protein
LGSNLTEPDDFPLMKSFLKSGLMARDELVKRVRIERGIED